MDHLDSSMMIAVYTNTLCIYFAMDLVRLYSCSGLIIPGIWYHQRREAADRSVHLHSIAEEDSDGSTEKCG